MSKVSFSRVDTWKQCPRKYKYRYIDGIEVEPDYSPTNPLVLGSALDKGIEQGYEAAEEYYWSQYHVATNEGVTELMKIQYWLAQLRPKFSKGQFQTKIETDRFIGFADYIEDGKLLVDFKYSNNVEKYAESPQLHLYASQMDPKPDYMAYVCVPKTFIRQKQTEDIIQFRKRVMETLRGMEVKFVWVDYDQSKVDGFWEDVEAMEKDKDFEPRPNDNCKYCEYAKICHAEPTRVLKPRTNIKIKY